MELGHRPDHITAFGVRPLFVAGPKLSGSYSPPVSSQTCEAVYKNITVGRHTKFGFDQGKPVCILDDPEGNSWVMKSFSLSGNTWYQAAYGANGVYYRVVPTP
jgi:hypothetical protein